MSEFTIIKKHGEMMVDSISIASEVEKRLSVLFGNSLVKVIIYGSYAEGGYDEQSDIDILALVTENDEDIENKRDGITDIVAEVSTKYNIFVSIIVKNEKLFYERAEYVPFYMNVARQGIEIHG
jgi:uncharacterized protein